jgi:hypothetical protein
MDNLTYILGKKYAQSIGCEIPGFNPTPTGFELVTHTNLNNILEKLILDAIGNVLFDGKMVINTPNINYNKEFIISASEWIQDSTDKEKYIWTKVHNLATKDLVCAVYNSLDEEVAVGVKTPDINTVILRNSNPFNGRIVINYSIEMSSNGGSNSDSNGTVKMTANDSTSKYLADLIDGLTIKNINGSLVATTLDGLTVTIAELNSLHSITEDIKDRLSSLSGTISLKDTHKATYADLSMTTGIKQGDAYIVDADETQGGEQTWYVFNDKKWVCLGVISVSVRDFLVNPLNVVTESTGIYKESRIDPLIARKSDIPSIPNLSLLTTYTQTDTDLADAVVKKHDHANKALLDTYTQTNVDLIDAVAKKHDHANKSVIDNFSEDSDGIPLYKGNPITSSGSGSGVSDLSTFSTADLKDTTNYRYVTDAEKANIKNLSAVVATQTNINNTLSTITNEISFSASSSNKLITTNEVDAKINNVKFVNLADVDHKVKPNSFIVTNSTGTQITYLNSIESMIKIQKITDKDGVDYFDIPSIKFKNMTGAQDSDGNLELTLQNLFTTDLKDMPAAYDNGKVLVANSSLQAYELKDIGTLTNSKENFTKSIDQTDWYHNADLEIYTCTVSHGLNSKNLIIGMVDAHDNSIGNVVWQIIDNNTVVFKSITGDSIRVVINCSQGATGSGTGGATNVISTDFIDDNRVRTDKTFSSYKIISALNNYAPKSTVYTKNESNSLYASKLNEHIHTNMSILDRITEDSNGNIYFGDQKLLTNLKPYTYQKHWEKQSYTDSMLLVDVNTIFNTNQYSAILNTEFTIQNNIVSVDEKTDALAENQVHLVVIDNSIVVLDVLIPPGSVQKYLLGISPNVQIMVQGQFSSNYYLTAY